MRGVVQRRWRKIIENSGREVVHYLVSGVEVIEYGPTDYFAIGEVVEVPVTVSAYQAKNGIRYSLVLPGKPEGEF